MTNSGGDRTTAWREAARAAGRTGARVLIAGAGVVIAGLAPPSAAPAFADADLTLGNGDKVRGTVNPSSERERYYVRLPEGAQLTVAVRGRKRRGAPTPAMTFAVSGPGDAALGTVVVKGTGARVTKLRVPAAGTHRITVTCTNGNAGDYDFAVVWQSPRAVPFAGTISGGAAQLPFTADPGSKATFTVAPAAGSAARPRLLRVDDGVVGAYQFDFPVVANVAAPGQTAKGVVLGGGGTYRLQVSNAEGAADGPFTGRVVVTPPKIKPRKLTLTGAAPDGGQSYAKGGPVGPEGGFIDGGTEGQGPVDGAAVAIPSGALTRPAIVVVGTGTTVVVPDAFNAGPPVSFTPDGLTFAAGKSATITLPFDPGVFPKDDFSTLAVHVRAANGVVSLVPPAGYEVDAALGTVSFPAAHFSTYQVFGPATPRPFDLDADGYDDLAVFAVDAGDDRGSLRIIHGGPDYTPSDRDYEIRGENTGGRFGEQVAIGDVSGDGVADLVVGVPPEHRVLIYFGGPGQLATSAADFDVEFSSSLSGSTFGTALAVGDVTGDGTADVIVGDPGYDGATTGDGAVFVFEGGPNLQSDEETIAVARIDGGVAGGRFGRRVTTGSLRGDGTADLVVSARESGTFPLGSVWIVTGGTALSSGTAAARGVAYTGSQPGGGFGEAIAAGDVTGDGLDDLVVGAPDSDVFDQGQQTNVPAAGLAYLFSGAGGLGGGDAATDAFRRLDAFPEPQARRGASLGIGQYFADPIRDLLIGEPGIAADSGPDAGGVKLLRGGSDIGFGYQSSTTDEAGARRGARILPPADLDRDGRRDMIWSEPGADSGAGAISIRFGPGLFEGRALRLLGAGGTRFGGD